MHHDSQPSAINETIEKEKQSLWIMTMALNEYLESCSYGVCKQIAEMFVYLTGYRHVETSDELAAFIDFAVSCSNTIINNGEVFVPFSFIKRFLHKE